MNMRIASWPDFKRAYKALRGIESALAAARAENDKLRGLREALELIAGRLPIPKIPEWDGDCCDGNYDDAHRHGIALGEAYAAQRALAALAALSTQGDTR
jgi:hypothetical protein